MTETKARILARVATWRVGGVILTVAITWVLTGDLLLGAEIGVAYNLIRFGTHFVHEWFWSRKIRWGRLDAASTNPEEAEPRVPD